MSEVKVNKISPRTACGTVTLGDSGDTIAITAGVNTTLGGAGSTITIPAGATITNSGTAAGFGATGETSWDTTVKTSTFTASAGVGYFCNTSGGAFTVNLPAGTAGASIAIADYAGTWQTNNLTISPNGTDKIGSLNQNATGNVEGQSITFVFVDSTQGWINIIDSTSNVRGNIEYMTASVSGACNTLATVDTNFKIATFTGPGTFTVCSISTVDALRNKIDYVVVAGGSGGANYAYGAGGGAGGGFRESYTAEVGGPYTASPLATPSSLPVSVQGYSITVGAGGTGGASGSSQSGNSGSNSVFSTITSAGGGGGGGAANAGGNGGSGGGGGGGPDGNGGAAGSGNTPPVSPSQGSNGGSGRGRSSEGERRGGGAGGAGGAGTDGTYPAGGSNGGAGVTTGAKSSPATTPTGPGGFSGGAAGSGGSGPFNGTPGGFGAGSSGFGNGGNGSTNSGAGGGASGANGSQGNGGVGGSGIVVIRYRFQ